MNTIQNFKIPILQEKLGSFSSKSLPKSINYHLTNACNYRCSFCFAKYGAFTKPLPITKAKMLIRSLVSNGCEKLNFAGGEPTLVPHLADLINYAKSQNLFVSLISNGTGITSSFLDQCGSSLDICGLSIDSPSNKCEFHLGRTLKSCQDPSTYNHVELIKKVATLIHSYQIPLKINTTLTQQNFTMNMHELILELKPIRWKVFQVHQVQKINDDFFAQNKGITEEQFLSFIDMHRDLHPIYETSEIMANSYTMITPDGRFYYSHQNTYAYSDPILDVGIEPALSQITFDETSYMQRGGNYYSKESTLSVPMPNSKIKYKQEVRV